MFSIRLQPEQIPLFLPAAVLSGMSLHTSAVPAGLCKGKGPCGLGKQMEQRVEVRVQLGQGILYSQKAKFSSMQRTNEPRDPGADTFLGAAEQDR